VIEAREGVFKAGPLDLADRAKLTYILDRLVEYEGEWSDLHADPASRRFAASGYLADALVPGGQTSVLEVWHFDPTPSLVGLLGFTKIIRTVDAQFHPIFFDGKLRNALGKRELLLRAVDWAFQTWDLHRLSVEVPGYSAAFIKFLRRKMGFRFEAEDRTIVQERVVPHGHLKTRERVAMSPTWREAEAGSRRFQAFRKHGHWHDLILLSVTREEFATFLREVTCPRSSTDPIPSKPSPVT